MFMLFKSISSSKHTFQHFWYICKEKRDELYFLWTITSKNNKFSDQNLKKSHRNLHVTAYSNKICCTMSYSIYETQGSPF